MSGADVLLCTHTGIPWQREVDGRLLVNVGTVGRPANDGRREPWYAVLDLEEGHAAAELVGLDYDWSAQAESMRAAGLPEPFAETVETGWWTTCLEVVPPRERARGRYHVYRDALPGGFAADGVGWADRPPAAEEGLPVMPLFGSPLFPARLWIYSNFHCNLACDYCVVASSPRATPRSFGLERFRRVVDEAVAEGFAELYVTGGEPFIERDIVSMIEYASDRLPTVVLTNAMLFSGRRREELARLAGRDGLVLQTSLDGARAETHDAWRGEGSWKRAMEGVTLARELGLPLRVAMTETPENRGEVQELRRMLSDVGIERDDFAVRPLIKRGFAREVDGAATIGPENLVPELTLTAEGVHWHPLGADRASSPDMVLATGTPSLGDAKRLVIERFLELRLADGTLPQPYQCAI
jgi:pyruvate-formate lyase-activating enzyme